MANEDRSDGGFSQSVRRLPADLTATAALLGVADVAALVIGSAGGALTFALVLPLLVFLPGYAVIAVLYPEAAPVRDGAQTDVEGTTADEARSPTEGRSDARIDWYERLTLSIGVSIAVVPLIAFVTVLALGRLRMVPVLAGTNLLTVGALALAVWRRRRLPPEDRFSVPYRDWIATLRGSLLEPTDRVDLVLNVALVASVILAAGVLAFTLTTPKPTDAHTEFYLLTENESGALVADGYPTEFVRGEGAELIVGLTNQEHEQRSYAVVAVVQNVSVTEEAITVRESRELRRFSTALDHGETWRERHEVAPTLTGERLRLAYLLYEGDVPAEPTFANADDQVFLWVNVSTPSGS